MDVYPLQSAHALRSAGMKSQNSILVVLALTDDLRQIHERLAWLYVRNYCQRS